MEPTPEVDELYGTARELWLSDELTAERLFEVSGGRADLLGALAAHAERVYLNDQIFLAGEIAGHARAALGAPSEPLL